MGSRRSRPARRLGNRAQLPGRLPGRVGGFPQAVAGWRRHGSPDPSFIQALWDVIYGEAITSARLGAAEVLTLLERLSKNLCSPLNVTDLARDIGVTPPTAAERLTDLADHFFAWPCYRAQGATLRPSAQRKWYFVDPIVARLAALRDDGSPPDLTQLSQQQIGVSLLRSVGAADAVSLADYDAVRYHRTPAGAEIDFVGPQFGGVAVKSKYTDDRWGRELHTIARSPWFGVLASRSGIESHDAGLVLPAPFVALLLGA